ncbi:MAG: sigma-70 family RNA polymerase sigma factor [Nibricoccus sp.]
MPETIDLTQLLVRRAEFKRFLTSRLGGNDADAEDLLQNSLTKALHAAATVNDREKLIPWFYQVLRHAVVDHVRSHQALRKREDQWTLETAALGDEESHQHVCRCFESLLPTLKPLHAELLRRVEMNNENVAQTASALGLTAGNASVILHRARKELRHQLEAFCGPCADKTCFDCDCGEA